MKLILTLVVLTSMVFSAEEAKPTPTQLFYDKVVASNLNEPSKAYTAYQDALNKANEKIVKALEGYKKDLNDTKKGSMSLTERADAIKEVDAKIAEIKKGSLGEIVARRSDLLGDGSEVDIKKMIVGKWTISGTKHSGIPVSINADKTAMWGDSLSGTWDVVEDKCNITWANGISYIVSIDKKKMTFKEMKNNGIISMGVLEHGNK